MYVSHFIFDRVSPCQKTSVGQSSPWYRR